MKWLAALPVELVKAGLLVTAFGSALLGLIAWAALFDHRLDFAANLAAVGLAASLLCGLIWIAGREPRRPLSTGPVALIGAVLWLGFIGPDVVQGLAQPKAQARGEVFKVIQFNLWTQDWTHVQARADWIKAEDPDAILLEEIGGAWPKLQAKLVKDYPYMVMAFIGPYSSPVAILSKQRPIAQGVATGEDNQPNFAWARYHSQAGDYALAVTHFTYPMPDSRQQRFADQLAKDLKGAGTNDLILGGDFNAAGWSFPMERLERTTGLVRQTHGIFTFPAKRVTTLRIPWPLAVLPIDHVFTRGAWKTVSVKRGPDLGSDHYPVVVTLTRDLQALRPTVPAAPVKAANAATPAKAVAKNGRAPPGTP